MARLMVAGAGMFEYDMPKIFATVTGDSQTSSATSWMQLKIDHLGFLLRNSAYLFTI